MVFALLFIISSVSALPHVYGAEYKTHQDSNYGFGIDYPSEWQIDNESIRNGQYTKIFQFYANSDWTGFVTVGKYTNNNGYDVDDNIAISQLAAQTTDWCPTASFEVDGYTCSNAIIHESKSLSVDELRAFQIKYSYDGQFENGDTFTDVGMMRIILENKNSWWEVYGQSWEDYAGTNMELIENSINSFGFVNDSESKPTKTAIPDWVKNVAQFWVEDQIDDTNFVQVIEYLVKEGVIFIPYAEAPEGEAAVNIPSWIKTSTEFWVNGSISDDEFAIGLEWMINNGVIRV